jgi:tetratricopeptide (TPR) repeat protein
MGCCLVLASGAAHADDATAENKALAQERYDAGKRAYDIGDFDAAIVEWKKAYQLFGAPDFLFNIAQACRQKRDYDEAIFFFNAYLRAQPNARNRPEVEALRDEMVALKNKEQVMRQAPPQDVQPVDASKTTSRPDPDVSEAIEPTGGVGKTDRGGSWRTGGVIAGATGLAFVATGLAFSLSASSTESDLEKAAANQTPWSDDLKDMEAAGERNATIGTSLMIVGGLGVVGGALAYYLGRERADESVVALIPRFDPASTGMGFQMRMKF